MIPINHIEERNGNYYLHYDTPDVSHCEKYIDKNSLIKAVASMIGVSILTSDEVKNQVSGSIEKTDWDTEPITHDGIQFNRHFIDLKLKVDALETEIVKLLKRLVRIEDDKEGTIEMLDSMISNELTSIGSYSGDRVHREFINAIECISRELKK